MKQRQKIAGMASLAALTIISGLVFPASVYAEDCAAIDLNGVCYDSFSEAMTALNASESASNTITFHSDLTDDKNDFFVVRKDVTIDLNGHDLTSSRRFGIYGITFEIAGNGQINLGDDMPLSLYGDTAAVDTTYTHLIVGEGVTLNSTYKMADDAAYIVAIANAKNPYGIKVDLNGRMTAVEDNYAAGVYVNGTLTDIAAEINVSDTAVMEGMYAGMYLAGDSITEFNGRIDATNYGIEVRAGKLTLGEKASITLPGTTEYVSKNNGNGSSTSGAAVAVMQHTTKLNTAVTINGGTYTAPVALAQEDPQGNGPEAISKVSIDVRGGTFNSNQDGKAAVVANDLRNFVSGGTFNTQIAENYIAQNYTLYEPAENTYVVDQNFADVSIASPIILGVGQKTTLNFGDNKYTTIEMAQNDAVEFDGETNTISAKAAGDAEFSVDNHKVYNNAKKEASIFVYDVDTAVDSKAEASQNSTSLVVESEAIDEKDIPAADLVVVETALANHALSVAGYFDVTVDLYNDGLLIKSEIPELSKAVKVTLMAPTDLPAVPAGHTRMFYVIRIHDGASTIIPATLSDDGTELTFESDKFSTYALAYADIAIEDEESAETPTTPDTGTFTREEVSEKATIVTAVLFSSTFAMVALIALAFHMRKDEK